MPPGIAHPHLVSSSTKSLGRPRGARRRDAREPHERIARCALAPHQSTSAITIDNAVIRNSTGMPP
jgi:hypothetical protein